MKEAGAMLALGSLILVPLHPAFAILVIIGLVMTYG